MYLTYLNNNNAKKQFRYVYLHEHPNLLIANKFGCVKVIIFFNMTKYLADNFRSTQLNW